MLIVVLVLLQRRGLLIHDTRFDLLLDPQRFLADAWDFWFVREDFGRVQNQRAGYFFPMGPFLVVGDVLGLAPWITERLWMALLLVLAWWGTTRLADELRIGTPPTRVLGAAAYALSPFFMGRTGAISAFVQGGALLPWIMVPLVRASREGSPRRGACRSAIAVALIGGTNAAVTVSVLVVPLLWLVTRTPGPRRRTLATWWGAAVVAVSVWWIVPLALQSRYGTDFFPISEQPSITTAYTAPFDVLRGAADWVGHLSFFGEPHLLSAEVATTDAIVILASGLLAAIGLAGLLTRSMPEARFLRVTLLTGIAIIASARSGILGDPASGIVLDLLESGPLAALRTLYKFQPVVLLPIALGIAYAVTVAVRRAPTNLRSLAPVGAIAIVAVVIVAGAKPLLTREFAGAARDAFEEVPSWWVDVGEHLDRTDGRSVLVPGLSKSASTWGLTEEEPLTWLTNEPWATRNQVPFGTYASTRYVDAVETAIANGGSPALPTLLERAGITQVVARNDARWLQIDAPSPHDVDAALTASGLLRTASFGPVLSPDQTAGARGLHPIEVYELPGAVQESRARFYPAESAAAVSGDSASLLELRRWGLTDRALVFAEDLERDQPLPPTWIVTDGNRRRTTMFGETRDNLGYVLGRHDEDPNASTDLEARLYPDQELADQTVSTYGDVRSVAASSYGSRLTPFPGVAPTKAIDNDERTAWRPAGASPTGEWIELELEDRRRLSDVEVLLRNQIPRARGSVTVRATTDQGSRSTRLSRSATSPQRVAIAPGPTKRLRLTIEDVTGTSIPGLGISEILVPDLEIETRLEVPDQLTTRLAMSGDDLPIYVFTREPSNANSTQPYDTESVMRRRFVLPRAGALSVQSQVLGQPSPEVLEIIGTTPTLSITASSTAGDLPRYAPRNLVDRQPDTYWVATYPDDNRPQRATIDLEWPAARSVDEITLTGVTGHRFPDEVVITAGDEERRAAVGAEGRVTFPPLVTDRLSIELVSTSDRIIGPDPITAFTNPLALTEVSIPAIDDLIPGPMDLEEQIEIPCGDGPSVRVGGSTRTFSVDASLGDLVLLRPVDATPCDVSPVDLPAGRVDLDAVSNGSPLTIESVLLATPSALDPPAQSRRSVTIDEWNATTRSLDLAGRGAGYLQVTENYNDGWEATIGSEELEPIVLDGWEQGFVVPASAHGTVSMEFGPNGTYQLGLVFGAVLVLLVGLGALVRGRRDDKAQTSDRPWGTAIAWTVAGVGMVVIGGVAVVLLVPLALLAFRRRTVLPFVAAAPVAVAAVFAATYSGDWSDTWGPGGDVVTVLALLGIATVAASLVSDRSAAGRGAPTPQPDDEVATGS